MMEEKVTHKATQDNKLPGHGLSQTALIHWTLPKLKRGLKDSERRTTWMKSEGKTDTYVK